MKYNFDKIANRRNSNSTKWNVKENALPMWIADMDFETLPEVKQAIINKANIGAYGYTDIPETYYQAVSMWWKKRHNFTFSKENIIFSTGVVAAISSIVRKITTVGENILVQAPVYNIFYNSILNNGRNVISNDLVYDNGMFHIDYEDLENKLSNPQTTMMILCNPHNPIGKVFTKEELTIIGELCHKYNVTVVSDEIHCDFVKPGLNYIPFASCNEINKDISITCIAPSKAFNLAGLQSASVIVFNPLLKQRVYRGLNNDEVAEPNFFAIEANIAAYTYGEEWINELNIYIQKNKDYFVETLNKTIPNLKVIPSQATYLLFIDISYYFDNAKECCKYLEESVNLILSEGSIYGGSGYKFVRINLATSKANVTEALNRLNIAFTNLSK